MVKIFFTMLVLSITPLFALLSPLNESLSELQTLLSSRELSQYFDQGETIQEIRRSQDSYIVMTHSKQMVVDIIYLPPQRIGPKRFKLIFHPAKTTELSH